MTVQQVIEGEGKLRLKSLLCVQSGTKGLITFRDLALLGKSDTLPDEFGHPEVNTGSDLAPGVGKPFQWLEMAGIIRS